MSPKQSYMVGDCARRFAVMCGLMPPDETIDEVRGCAEHVWGEWVNDPVGVVRECFTCGAIDWRPEG